MYRAKYIKYKTKYILLKQHSSQTGGSKLFTIVYDKTPEEFIEIVKNEVKKYGYSYIDNQQSLKSNVSMILYFNTIYKTFKKYYNVSCEIKNLLDGIKSITNKCNLHMNLMNLKSDIVPKTCDLMDMTKIRRDEILIARPCGSMFFGGKGIRRINNTSQLIDLQKELRTNISGKTLDGVDQMRGKIILTKYITDPLLFGKDKLKCHFRMYMLVTYAAKPHRQAYDPLDFYVANVGRIFTAREPYVKDDWDRVEIHDTHTSSTKQNYFYPDDCDKLNVNDTDKFIKNFDGKLQIICKQLFDLVKKNIKPFEEHKNGFVVFGIDLMSTADEEIYLIECNDSPGFKNLKGGNYNKFATNLVHWMISNSIGKI